MENFWKIAGYIATALAIFIAGWQLSSWIKGENVHIREVATRDTFYVAVSLPKIIEKPVYIEKKVRVRDTVYKITEKERIVEIIKRDTVWYAANPKWLVGSDNGDYSELPGILRADREIPEIVIPYHKTEKREWWEDLLYVGGTAAVTYGLTRIK